MTSVGTRLLELRGVALSGIKERSLDCSYHSYHGPFVPSLDDLYHVARVTINTRVYTSLCLNSVSEVLCCKNYYWVEFTARFHSVVGFSIIFQKPAVCCIVPIDVQTPLPQYPQDFGNYHPDPEAYSLSPQMQNHECIFWLVFQRRPMTWLPPKSCLLYWLTTECCGKNEI